MNEQQNIEFNSQIRKLQKVVGVGVQNLEPRPQLPQQQNLEPQLPKEWEVVPLDNKYIEFQNGLWKGKKEPYIKVRVLRNTNFNNDGTIDFEDVAELNVEQRNFKNREIIKDDIILERSGGGPTQPVGRVVFFEREDQFMYSFSNFTSRIRINDKLIIFPKFLFYFLLDFYYQGKTNDIQNRTTGIRNLDFSRYKQIPIPLPPLPEQQKIAAVLSAVQEAKEKTEAVIAAIKALKKSMVKHLFTYGPVSPQEAENVPLKETEIGPVPEDWKVVRLGEIGNIITGNTPSKNKKEYWEKGEIEFIKPPDLQNQIITTFSEKISNSAVRKARIVNKGTILVSCIGIIGRVGLSQKSIAFNQQINAIVPNENIYNHFLFYAIQVQQKQIENLASFTTVPIVSKAKFSTVKIPLPPLPIQQKIASILSAIDEKIEAEENKKKALEELFKSLLHDLMTAKIRVNQLEISS